MLLTAALLLLVTPHADGPATPQLRSGQEAEPLHQQAEAAKKHTGKTQEQAKSGTTGSPSEELQRLMEAAGNDRAALVRNFEAFLEKYPQAAERPQIYRALVEACMQLNDTPKAAAYAERLVALAPEDISMTLLAIQLLEKGDDESALRRAVNYSTRIIEYVRTSGDGEKSPKVSQEDWQAGKKRDEASLLLLRAALQLKLHDQNAARSDAETSYGLVPSAAAALKIGELDEMTKNYPGAIKNYARAYTLADPAMKLERRRDLRQKLGNVWKLSRGSEAGLGEYLLATFDELSKSPSAAKQKRNAEAKTAFEFTLRRAPSGGEYPLAAQRGKVTVVNFWATWCGPCRALEPLYEKVAAQFSGDPNVVFLAADCDEDESLVAPYLEEIKPKTTVVFADGLDRFYRVEAFPTVVVLDRDAKVTYRSDGFGDSGFFLGLTTAVKQAMRPAQ